MNIFPDHIPSDIQNVILEYSGYHKLRNGYYARQLCLHNKLYTRLQRRISRCPKVINGYVILNFSKNTTIVLFDHFENLSSGRL